MSFQLQVKRGAAASIPTLADGEFYWATDTKVLWAGYNGTNYPIAGPGFAGTALQLLIGATAAAASWGFPDGRSLTHVGARGYRSAAGTGLAINNAYTTIPIDAEAYDTNSILDSTTNKGRFTVPSGMGGKWLMFGRVGMGSFLAAGVTIGCRWYLNGTTTLDENVYIMNGTGNTYPASWAVYTLAATDYVECQGFQNSGVNQSFVANAALCWAGAFLLETN